MATLLDTTETPLYQANSSVVELGEYNNLYARIVQLEHQKQALELDVHRTQQQLAASRVKNAEVGGRAQEYKRLLEERKSAELKYRAFFDLAPVGYVCLNEAAEITDINLAGTCFLGRSRQELIGSAFAKYLTNADHEQLNRHLSAVGSSHLSQQWVAELTLHDGTMRQVLLLSSAIRTERSSAFNFQVIIVDISQQIATERRLRNANGYLENLALHDPLTGLPNRTQFTDYINALIGKKINANEKVGIVYFDLDGFKPINDTLGHDAGDKVLCVVAERVSQVMASGDMVARLGGDEFVIILDKLGDSGHALVRAKQIAELIRQPIKLAQKTVKISSSMGISVFPDHSTSVEELVRGADVAMYHSKQAGRDKTTLFNRETNESHSRLSIIATSFDKAISDDQLSLHFQPIYDAKTLTIRSVEALIRWHHPQLGDIPPSEFISIAEKNGRIIELGNWVLESACKQARLWKNEGFHIPIAINVSTRQLQNADFAALVKQTLQRYQLTEQSLEIELSESTIVQTDGQSKATVNSLDELGLIITIDDFGTNHSCLAELDESPVSRLKINQSFIKKLDHSEAIRSIVRSLIMMAHRLGLEVYAEGIEEASQLEFLSSQGCDAVQGFMMSRAELPGDITHLLQLDRERLSGLSPDLPRLDLEQMSS